MGGNTSIIKALRSYLTKVLDVLVPDAGKEALAYVLENDRARHTENFGTKGDDLVNNMLRVYIITTTPDIKDLMLQQMCAVLKRTDLNTRLGSVQHVLTLKEHMISRLFINANFAVQVSQQKQFRYTICDVLYCNQMFSIFRA